MAAKGFDDLEPVAQENEHVPASEHAPQEGELRFLLERFCEPLEGSAEFILAEILEAGLASCSFEEPCVVEADERFEGAAERVERAHPSGTLLGEVGESLDVRSVLAHFACCLVGVRRDPVDLGCGAAKECFLLRLGIVRRKLLERIP